MSYFRIINWKPYFYRSQSILFKHKLPSLEHLALKQLAVVTEYKNLIPRTGPKSVGSKDKVLAKT